MTPARGPGAARPMHVAVVGAGPSGLAAARTFTALGMSVAVYEARDDIGGVWSGSRAYPGISTQNDKHTYAYSGNPMADDVALIPSGAEVRGYLQDHARRHGLDGLVRLGTRVSDARQERDGWSFDATGPDGVVREHADWLVVANGLCSTPYLPRFDGADGFAAAGGRVLSPSDVGDAESLRGRHVVVVGWGKSASDIATAAAPIAASVTVVARRIGWKLPRRVRGVPFQRFMLSRLGEHLLWGPYRTPAGRALRIATRGPRALLVPWLGRQVVAALELERRGLVPDARADELDHLVTDGFLEAIDAGTIAVRRGTRIAALAAEVDGARWAELSDGARVRADVVVAATGYDQDLGLLSEVERTALLDDDGDLRLIRHALPEGLDGLAFVGWVGSFRSAISAEVQSMWVASHMLGLLRIPAAARRRPAVYRLSHERAAQRGAPQLPENGSFLTVDAWLQDLGLRVGPWRRRRELLGPMLPDAYADLLDRLRDRAHRRGALPSPAPHDAARTPVASSREG